jgi:hypothetical protein
MERLRIPPDWIKARKHGMCRRATEELKNEESKKVCDCCGYEIYRRKIDLGEDYMVFKFLGSAFPLLFNFTIHAIFLLFTMGVLIGVPFIKSNQRGQYCWHNSKIGVPSEKLYQTCFFDAISTLSMINSIQDQDIIEE